MILRRIIKRGYCGFAWGNDPRICGGEWGSELHLLTRIRYTVMVRRRTFGSMTGAGAPSLPAAAWPWKRSSGREDCARQQNREDDDVEEDFLSDIGSGGGFRGDGVCGGRAGRWLGGDALRDEPAGQGGADDGRVLPRVAGGPAGGRGHAGGGTAQGEHHPAERRHSGHGLPEPFRRDTASRRFG